MVGWGVSDHGEATLVTCLSLPHLSLTLFLHHTPPVSCGPSKEAQGAPQAEGWLTKALALLPFTPAHLSIPSCWEDCRGHTRMEWGRLLRTAQRPQWHSPRVEEEAERATSRHAEDHPWT